MTQNQVDKVMSYCVDEAYSRGSVAQSQGDDEARSPGAGEAGSQQVVGAKVLVRHTAKVRREKINPKKEQKHYF